MNASLKEIASERLRHINPRTCVRTEREQMSENPVYLDLEQRPSCSRPDQNIGGKQPNEVSWEKKDQMLIDEFKAAAKDLPMTPLVLRPGVTVTNPFLFYRSLELDIAAGPKGPRTLYGALQSDLDRLLKIKRCLN